MTVFKYFWKIMFSKGGSILIMFAMFMALNILFVQNVEEVTEVTASELTIAIIDEDSTVLSRGLSTYLEGKHDLVEIENEESVIQDALFFREVTYILLVPAGFEADFVADPTNAVLENVKVSGSITGMFVDTQVENFLVTVYTYLNANFEMDVAVRNTITDLNLGVEVEILQGRVIDNSRSYFQFFTYLMLTAIMMGISPIFFTFNQKDVAKRNDCSSTTLLNRNMQLTLGCGIAAIAMWAVSFIPLFFMHQEEVFTIVTLYRVINTLALLAVSVGIAFLVGNLLNNRDALTGASTIIAMGLCFLSGVFVPQEFLGEGVLMVARFLPTYWYIRGNNVLSGVLEVTGETGRIFWEGFFIQFGFAIALFAVTLMFIRQKKLKAVV